MAYTEEDFDRMRDHHLNVVDKLQKENTALQRECDALREALEYIARDAGDDRTAAIARAALERVKEE